MLTFFCGHLIWLMLWGALVAPVYEYTHWRCMALLPKPVSLVGNALAFYVDLKNSSSLDRLWAGI